MAIRADQIDEKITSFFAEAECQNRTKDNVRTRKVKFIVKLR